MAVCVIPMDWECVEGAVVGHEVVVEGRWFGSWWKVRAYFFARVCANQNFLCTFALQKMVLWHIGWYAYIADL